MWRTRIAADVGRNVSIYVADQLDALFLRLEHQHVAHALDAGLEVEIEVLERHLARLQLAEVQDVVHLNGEREREKEGRQCSVRPVRGHGVRDQRSTYDAQEQRAR